MGYGAAAAAAALVAMPTARVQRALAVGDPLRYTLCVCVAYLTGRVCSSTSPSHRHIARVRKALAAGDRQGGTTRREEGCMYTDTPINTV